MSDNTVLEGLALRRAVAEARGWQVKHLIGNAYELVSPYGSIWKRSPDTDLDGAWKYFLKELPASDTDLNTLKDAAAMLPDTHKLEVRWYPDETIAIVDVVGSISWRVNRITVSHTEPATAAWNAVLRWLAARKQEAGDESVK